MTDPTAHLFWITSRAAGTTALVLASVAVAAGLLMGTRVVRGKRAGDLRSLHEVLSLATLLSIAVHAFSLRGHRRGPDLVRGDGGRRRRPDLPAADRPPRRRPSPRSCPSPAPGGVPMKPREHRTRRIRRYVVTATVTLFLAVWSVVYTEMRT